MTAEKFWAHVDRRSTEECWLFTGYRDKKGYGTLTFNGKPQYAHRVAWLLAKGPIPTTRLICHHCDVPGCCNPAHLFVGTHADNRADAIAKGRAVFPAPKRGEKARHAKLTTQEIVEIRRLRANGVDRNTIASRFGVTPSNVYYVTARKSWRHVL